MYCPNLFKAGGSNPTYCPDFIRINVPMPTLGYNNKSYPQTWSVVKLSEKGTKPSSRLSVSWRKVRNLTLDYLCEASFYVGLDSSKVSLILKEILVFSFF